MCFCHPCLCSQNSQLLRQEGKKQNNNKAGEKSQSLLRKGKAWHRDYHPSQDSKKAMASWLPAMGWIHTIEHHFCLGWFPPVCLEGSLLYTHLGLLALSLCLLIREALVLISGVSTHTQHSVHTKPLSPCWWG